ncbi:MAG: hypothetical protein IJ326_06630 [Lachnospiraceae bacterium]|nr:hypothetical protein [Lachnospiraceae bacterium]
MAKKENMTPDGPAAQKLQVKENRKQLQAEQKNYRKEAKRKAKELELQEREIDEQLEGSSASVAIVTLFIICIWLGILCLVVKMDVGGFGSKVLTPIFKDVPVINMILPSETNTETEETEVYGGYSSLRDAVDQITKLEKQLSEAQAINVTYVEQIEALKAQVERLQTFEDSQLAFQDIKEAFYEDVVYAENGPGVEEYRTYYEEMDPATAAAIYEKVIEKVAVDKKIQEYSDTFKNMQASDAADILCQMTDNLELAAKILENLDVEDRGAIMAEMTPSIAAKVAKIMDPNS